MRRINNVNGITSGLIIASCVFYSCTSRTGEISPVHEQQTGSLSQDTIVQPEVKPVSKELTAEQIEISKDLLYDQYTLEDTYPCKDTTRQFQWGKIKGRLTLLENTQLQPSTWAILQNYRNRNGEAPLVRSFERNAYGRIADTLGIKRYQSVPLYLLTDTLVSERCRQDGELTHFIEDGEKFIKTEPMFTGDEWMIPKKYVKVIGDAIIFNKAVSIDRHSQNIASLERSEKRQWVIRSMNPSTTGRHLPPYAQETPLEMFVLQEKEVKMVFLRDGSKKTGGYAPYASHFTDGAYIHEVPVNAPHKTQIKYSPSLGTTPRSHMYVRDATFHAKFIYDWVPVNETIVFVLE